MAVEISQHQFHMCQEANEQFHNVYAPLQLLTNPPYCTTALYMTKAATISTRCSLQIRKTQSISIPSPIVPNGWILTCTVLTFYSNNHHNPHLPRRNHKICYSKETHPHLATTTSLQCYITTLLSTSMI